jgi:hypothetical protein
MKFYQLTTFLLAAVVSWTQAFTPSAPRIVDRTVRPIIQRSFGNDIFSLFLYFIVRHCIWPKVKIPMVLQ